MNSPRPRTRWAGALAVVVLALVAPTGRGPAGATTVPVTPAFVPVPAASPVREDVDGDGYPDLAVADGTATVDGRHGAGRVTVLYGGPDGPSTGDAGRRAEISRATRGVPGTPVAGEGFGSRVARGDLDADGYADLVVTSAGTSDAVIVWGGPHGLSGATSVPAATAWTGDFDGDGLLDLVLLRRARGDGATGIEATVRTGPLRRTGVSAREAALDPGGLAHVEVVGGATGDVDGDGRDDLVLSAHCGAGAFCTYVYRSAAAGPVRTAGHRGGPAVAVGDLDGDGYADVVVDAGIRADPRPDAGTAAHDGEIARRFEVAHGSAAGIGEGVAWTSVTVSPTPEGPAPSGAGARDGRSGAGVPLLDTDADGCADLAAPAAGEPAGHGTFRVLSGCPEAAGEDPVRRR
ncbi:FG-GAP repeat domain-containing protein [Streptomyces sp. NPDC059271]|uniref:FG-GAP repeat domain-containing protein n=1 Tax=Streptomyces sp. NPDC059271 TaxID=3346799 RepID=UPI0036832922